MSRLGHDVRRLLSEPTLIRRLPSRLLRDARYARQHLRAIRRLVEKEREWEVPLSARRPRWWLRGFLSRSSVLYDLDSNHAGHYISDFQRYTRTKRMVHPRLQDVINNKLTTHLLLRALDVPSSELLGVCWRGAVHAFPTSEEQVPTEEFLRRLADDRRIFVKPLTGAEGKRVTSIRRVGDRYRMNGRLVDLVAAAEEIDRENHPLIVEEGIEQHDEQRKLFPETTNTIRLLTMLNMEDRQPFIVTAVQRIGTASSGHVDNWTRGGLSARIDLETGQLGRATRLPEGADLQWYDEHPDTGAPITGVQVPYWPEVRQTILHAARVVSFMEYIGWDIVVTPDGPVVLEANINSGMNVLQVHEPLLTDPRVLAYYARRGVVRDATDFLPPEQTLNGSDVP